RSRGDNTFLPCEGQMNQESLPKAEFNLNKQVDYYLNQLTIEEKFKLLAGNRIFNTHSIKRLGIKPFKMTDGPFGVSMHSSLLRKNTRFPGGINLAASWNRRLAREFGIAVGEEVRALGRHAILAPGININRSPLNGRTFEYLSEDPFLTKELAIPQVRGIQEEKKVAACIKHYAANNQETNRYTTDAQINERTLHEIYLRAFKDVVKEADPWMIMSSYNKVNGKYLMANKELLRDLVFDQWNFKGFVVSDWYACSRSKPRVLAEDCIKAGMSLEMPKADVYHPDNLQKAFNEGKISEEDLDDLLCRIFRVMALVGLFEKDKQVKNRRNTPEHQELARKMAEDGMVLLKNENNILPLNINEIDTIAIVGPNKEKKFGKLLYGGSSAVKPPYEITPLKGLKDKCKNKVKFVNEPSEANVVIIFVGLNHDSNVSFVPGRRKKVEIPVGNDTEGIDRIQLELPEEQKNLISKTVQENPKTIVVLLNGSPIAMEGWLEKVPVVLEAWYPGMEGGNAIANIVFGDTNPSGKLPMTFPKKLSDSPAHKSSLTWPGEGLKTKYEEGLFVGYRYFDKENIEPLFPFGYGLSYTKFTFNNFSLDKKKFSSSDTLNVSVDVTNSGKYAGAEVLQIYFHDVKCSVERPMKELIGFEKVYLDQSATKTVKIAIKARDLAFYDIDSHNWKLEPGEFKIYAGNSSSNIFFEEIFEITE
ncbi:MAG: beta-glucosidase, partial [Candidatus Hodarchaeales archaeon]